VLEKDREDQLTDRVRNEVVYVKEERNILSSMKRRKAVGRILRMNCLLITLFGER
jgi:hypothetical protein